MHEYRAHTKALYAIEMGSGTSFGDHPDMVGHAIPLPLTPLIGREQELQKLSAMLVGPKVRLLSLTGTGGTGKTNLALTVGFRIQEAFTHGVYFVSLANVTDPEEVMPTIARSLGIAEQKLKTPFECLMQTLSERHMLLILDNFEQVLPAAVALTQLLSACPRLKILVTTRTRLRIRGEHEFVLQPLTVPDLLHLPDLRTLAQVPAVTLFLQRVQAFAPSFQLTEQNARTVAQICTRLDGLPLALELAAVRLKILSPEALLARLDHRLHVLSANWQDAPPRQQTLQNLIDWSYELLTHEEQALFRRLSIFWGGATVEAVESMTQTFDDAALPVLELISSLIDQSLLLQREQPGKEPRLHLLETIREYGMERLVASGELERCQTAHAIYYLALAEQAFNDTNQIDWQIRLEQEHENLLAALRYLLDSQRLEEALRMASALQYFWLLGGYLNGGNAILHQIMKVAQESHASVADSVWLRALIVAGIVGIWLGDLRHAATMLAEGEQLARRVQDTRSLARILIYQAFFSYYAGNETRSNALLDEAMRLCQEIGDQRIRAEILVQTGSLAFANGAFERAKSVCEEALTINKTSRNTWGMITSLHFLSWVAYIQNDYGRAYELAEALLALFRPLSRPFYWVDALLVLTYCDIALGYGERAQQMLENAFRQSQETGNAYNLVSTYYLQGYLALHRDELGQALDHYTAALTLLCKVLDEQDTMTHFERSMTSCLRGLGELAFAQGKPIWTVQLFAAAAAISGHHKRFEPMGIEKTSYERVLATVHVRLDKTTFEQAWKEGLAMSPAQVLAAVKDGFPGQQDDQVRKKEPAAPPKSPGIPHDDLTPRQVEVLQLLAQGLSNAEIADRLIVSPHTVNRHVQTIYNKLGVNSRSAATRYALEHHLATEK